MARMLGAITVAAASLCPAPAAAFCRSTTCSGDCPRDENDCKTTGKALYWASACVGFSMQEDASEHIPIKYARPPIQNAFFAWTDVPCGDGTIGNASIAFSEQDEVSCAKAEFNKDGANANIMIFQDNRWIYTGSDNTLAKTTVTFSEETGEILDADIEINHANNFFTVSDQDVAFDLQAIMTHEVGHFIGLDHSPDFDATMFAGYDEGSIEARTLELDDVEAVCTVYPPGRDAICDTDPEGGFSGKCGGESSSDGDAAEDEGGCAVSPLASDSSSATAIASVLGLFLLGLARRSGQSRAQLRPQSPRRRVIRPRSTREILPL